ncbi:MAG: restriction endonuclease subunit S [Flavobacteriales bacterium]|nr:restriction endonuclease subunit S [Flavobacteriales bacterium]
MTWQRKPFESLFSEPTRNGLTRPSGVRGEGYRMVNMGEIFGHDRIGDIEMERVQLNDRELATMLLRVGDLLFARQSLVLAGAGKCTLVEQVNEPTTFESHIIRVRLDPKKADPRFYHYLFQSPYSGVKAIVTQGVQAGIRASDLAVLKVPVPDPEEQRRIAAILSSYDDLIENNRKRIKLLERAARLLYTEWFVRGRFPGHQGVKVKDGVPEGWEKTVFGKLVEQVKVSVKPEEVEADTPYIGLEHIPRRALVLNEWGKAEQVTSNKFAFQEDDILFGKIRPYFHKVGFAITNGITSSDAIVMRVSEPDLYALALSVVSSDRFIAVASKSAKEGSKMPRADWKQMQAYPLLLPDTRTLSKFNEALHPMLSMMKVLAKQNIQLIRARDLLLPRLMSGKVKA